MTELEMESKLTLVDEKSDKSKRKRKTTITLQDSLKSLSGAVRILTRRYGFQEIMNTVLWTNPNFQQVALKMMKGLFCFVLQFLLFCKTKTNTLS